MKKNETLISLYDEKKQISEYPPKKSTNLSDKNQGEKWFRVWNYER